jgi:hypothetical protein
MEDKLKILNTKGSNAITYLQQIEKKLEERMLKKNRDK